MAELVVQAVAEVQMALVGLVRRTKGTLAVVEHQTQTALLVAVAVVQVRLVGLQQTVLQVLAQIQVMVATVLRLKLVALVSLMQAVEVVLRNSRRVAVTG